MLNFVSTRQDFDDMLAALANESIVGADTETTGLDWWKDKIIGVSLASMTQAWYIAFRHASENSPIEWLAELGDRMAGRQQVGANFNFDLHFLRREPGWRIASIPDRFDDVQIAAYTLNENQPLKLEELASTHLGIVGGFEEMQLYADLARVLGKKKPAKADKAQMWRLPGSQVAPYAARDALNARQLHAHFAPMLDAQPHARKTYASLIEYQAVLHQMEEHGVRIDRAALERYDVIARQKRDEWVASIHHESGGVVENPNSSAQLKKWMGVDSTAKKKLERVLADENCDEALPAKVKMVQSLRQWEIATGRYYSAIRDALDGDVLHPQLRITGAVVRLSCGRPNMQAIPKTKDAKPHPAYHGIKASIIAREGSVLCEMDYSQAEIVVGAHYCRQHLQAILKQDKSRLSKWAKLAAERGKSALYETVMSGVNLHDKIHAETGLDRDSIVKPLNFMVPYGTGAQGLADFCMIPLEDARKHLEAHYTAMPEWRSLYETMQYQAKTAKKVTLWSGRTRHFTGSEKEHSAMNNLVQGAVSELMRVTICRLARELPELQMGLTVHDSIIADAPSDHADEIWRETSRIASDFPWLDPGIRMDYKRGPSWASATAPKPA